MPELPLVSIVICSYNNSRYITDALDSVKAQTYPNIELIIVDDYSTDNSVPIVEEWMKSYNGICKFVRLEQNKGGAHPYNLGLRMATGKYYVALDSDDMILPDKLAKQVKILEDAGDKVAAVYSDAIIMDIDGKQTGRSFIEKYRQFSQMPSGNVYEILLQGNFIPLMSMMIKKEALDKTGDYDERLVYGDLDLWLRIAKHYKILFSDYVSGKYRIRPGSMSFTTKHWEYSNLLIFLKHTDGALSPGWVNETVVQAYKKDDADAMQLVRALAVKTKQGMLMTLYILWKFRIAPGVAEQIIGETSGRIHIDFDIAGTTDNHADDHIFHRWILPWISPVHHRTIAANAYYNNAVIMRPAIKCFSKGSRSGYFNTILILWKFKVNKHAGEIILNRIDGYFNEGRNRFYINLCLYKDILGAIRGNHSTLFKL